MDPREAASEGWQKVNCDWVKCCIQADQADQLLVV